MNEIKKEIHELEKKMKREKSLYYRGEESGLTDFQFDQLMRRLEELERAHPEWRLPWSPTHRVGSDLDSRFEKQRHTQPMLSITNAYTPEELVEFDRSIREGIGC